MRLTLTLMQNFYLNSKPGVVKPVNGSYMTILSALISSTSRLFSIHTSHQLHVLIYPFASWQAGQ